MKNPIYVLLAVLPFFCCSATHAQVVEQVLDKAIEIAVDEIPSILLSKSELDNPGGGAIDTTMDWTAIWRSSDSLGGRSTQFGPNDWEVRPKGKRIGCICMDGLEDDSFGRGACAGHGGVRYWVYKTPDGKEMHHPTARHFRHPDPLSSDEKSGLAANNEAEDKPMGSPFGSKNMMDNFVNLSIILASFTMVIYFMRQMLAPKRKSRSRRPARKAAPKPAPPQETTEEEDDGLL
ncbi:MAG: hypothetical protein K9J37_04995 [Saprospiraceae bacterium]|nr:hypothetical protein [Saprospiraceae bacterium]MCF8249244.1 hypothetical protein [Saprospiraceae bacterium]MCF8281188.1 hypothetical protein [Bacteroidales bacterium]MCF8311479.1 hypothetical protein [Saprospiraceae bacterium]MCF8439863.1 hypothetical protein [Saprospiraceae bacterium]